MRKVRWRDITGGGSEQLFAASLRGVGSENGGKVSCRLDVAGANRVGSGSAQPCGAKALATKTAGNAVKTRASIGEVFPEWSKKIDHPALRATVWQILCHRSGLATGNVFENLDASPQEWRKSLLYSTLSKPAVGFPGEKYFYSAGPTYAVSMVERLSGKTFETLLKEEFAQPLALGTFGLGKPWEGESGKKQPASHILIDGQLQVAPSKWNSFLKYDPSGGIHASITDFCKFGMEHGERTRVGKEYLKQETFRYLQKCPFGDGILIGGWAQNFDNAGKWIWANGSSGVGDASVLFIEPKKQIVIAAVANLHNNDGGFPAVMEIVNAVKGASLR